MAGKEPTQPRSNFNEQLNRIETALIGNGREGLIPRTARIEERLERVSDFAEETKKVAQSAAEKMTDEINNAMHLISALTINVTKLESTVSTHIGTDHLSVLMKKKQFWALIIIGFIVLHLVSTYMPNLWDFIVVLLGVPKLAIPLN